MVLPDLAQTEATYAEVAQERPLGQAPSQNWRPDRDRPPSPPVNSCTDPQRHFPRLRRGPASSPQLKPHERPSLMSTPNVPPGGVR
jgi:hypothetical protein